MKPLNEQIELINVILNVVDAANPKGKSFMNFDALHAIRKVLNRHNEWARLSNKTVLKRKLKKNGVILS